MTAIIGHQKQRASLERLAESERLPQALIFSGPASIGKFAVASAWAGTLIAGSEHDAERVEIEADRLVLEPEQVTVKGVTRERDIPVEAVRETVQQALLSPSNGHRRVIIIRDAHRLTEKSQNALLKTLEEPPRHLVIILVTHRIGKLLPTILSRCQVVDFHLVDESELRAMKPLPKDVPEFLWQAGRPGLLRQFADAPARFKRDIVTLEQLQQLSQTTLQARLQLSEALSKDTGRAARLLEWWLTLKRHQAQAEGSASRQWQAVAAIAEAQQRLENQSKSVRLLLDTLFLSI